MRMFFLINSTILLLIACPALCWVPTLVHLVTDDK
jgi:hypothetical protein